MIRSKHGIAKYFMRYDLSPVVGFVSPIVEIEDNSLAMQIVDPISGLITEFQRIATETQEPEAVHNQVSLSVGDRPIFGFFDGKTAVLGSREFLRANLLTEIHNTSRSLILRYQIAQVLEEKLFATGLREEVFRKFTKLFNRQSANNFAQSSVDIYFDDQVISLFRNANISETNLISVRRNCRAMRLDNGLVTITGLDELGSEEHKLKSDLRCIVNELNTTFKNLIHSEQNYIKKPSAIGMNLPVMGRQEERVVWLIGQVLKSQSTAGNLLQNYKASSAFERRAVDAMLQSFFEQRKMNVSLEMEATILISKIYNDVFAINRGLFLMYVSKHLSKYTLMRNFVRHRLNRTTSKYILPYASEIERFLSEATPS